MQFSKYHQPKNRRGGRKPSEATLAKRRAEEEARQKEIRAAEEQAFAEFMNAKEGDFDGFRFVKVFHEHFNKDNAIYSDYADDSAAVETPFGNFNAGEDGIKAYFFSEQPTKRVLFNRSTYFI